MTLRRLAAAAAAVALCLTLSHDGETGDLTPYAGYVSKQLSTSKLRLGVATRVNALQADGANRVWAVTDKGVAAILIDRLATFFPLTKISNRLLGDEAKAVAFGPVDGDENFFLGYNGATPNPSGLQYGRILSQTGVSYPPNTDNGKLLWPDPVAGINLINALSSDGADLWAATAGGLARWKLGGSTPTDDDVIQPGGSAAEVQQVATDPWTAGGSTVYASGQSLYVAPSESAFATLPGSATVVSMAFDGARTLWVGTSADELYRFPYSGNTTAPYGARTGPYPIPAPRDLVSVAVDPLSTAGTVVWVGTDTGAYFQAVDAGGELTGTWIKAQTGPSDQNVRTYVDPSGNLWFGSDFGVRSLLSRLLTISGSQFVGFGASATVELLDVNPNAPDAPPAEPPATLTVYVVKQGGTLSAAELTLTASLVDAATRSYRATFNFGSSKVAGKTLGVTDSTTAVFFDVVYEFGPEADRRELPRATFSWANEVPFEDDAWVGGPCFLRVLGR